MQSASTVTQSVIAEPEEVVESAAAKKKEEKEKKTIVAEQPSDEVSATDKPEEL